MWTIFQTIKRSWAQHFVSQISGFTILFISYSAAILVALSLVNIGSLFEIWGRVNKVTVYLNSNVEKQELEQVKKYLESQEMIKGVQFVNSSLSAERFNKKFENMASTKLDTNQLSQFFPEYYEVELNETLAYKAGGSKLEEFAATLMARFPTVKDVSYGKSWLRRYVTILNAINYMGFLMIVIFMVGSLVVSSSVIKTILFSRRDEIEILEFIGASDSTIYLPQLVNVSIVSGMSFLFALLSNQLLFIAVKDASANILSVTALEHLQFLSFKFCVVGTFISMGSVAIYALYTVYKMKPSQQKIILFKEGEV